MTVTKDKKDRASVHKWTYLDRPMTIEKYSHAPNYITFFGGVHVPTDRESYSLTKVSKLQKKLRQRLWQYLTNNKLNSENYILKIDAPAKPTGNKVYLELVIGFQPLFETCLVTTANICEQYMNKLVMGWNGSNELLI
jgi:hypothetical protein